MKRLFQIVLAFFITSTVQIGSVPASEDPIDFATAIEPTLREHCFDCHGPDEANGRFRVDRLASLLSGGDSGEAAVVPGDPADSFLMKAIRHEEPGYEMPPDSDPLSEADIASIERWIAEGAKVPEHYGPAREQQELTHWSFRPIVRPVAPEPGGIDGFIRDKLVGSGLEMSPQADRRTLIRRLFLVMHGLPPSPERVEAFLADQRTDAWHRLIVEVLESPHYGERWATHWLDLVRFGETHGFETNRERPDAWRYRDWVIDTFNRDLPYDEFIRRQIVGDALGDDVATGFLVAGPFDAVKGQDPKLRQMQRMNELDDMINTTGTAFLGLTTGCARCHNHKFDPISQVDYYALQAVFAGVQHGERELPLPLETRQELDTLDAEIADLKRKLRPFLPRVTDAVIALDEKDAEYLVEPRGTAAELLAEGADLSRGHYTYWGNQTGQDVVRYRPEVSGPHRIWLSWGAGFASHTEDARYLLETASGRREIARVNQQLPVGRSGKPDQRKHWSGLFDAGVFDLEVGDSIVLQSGETGSTITADLVIFQPVNSDATASRPGFRPPVNAKQNTERFHPREARFIRFTIEEVLQGQGCLDELEIYAGNENVALASAGAVATSSGDFVHPRHKLAHINDGKYGNDRSWIAKEVGRAWVQIELPRTVTIDRIEWGRDRRGKFTDRLPVRYRIDIAVEKGQWLRIAGSSDRWPVDGEAGVGGDYQFTGVPQAEAAQGHAWLQRLTAVQEKRNALSQSPLIYAGKFEQPGPTHRLYRGEPDQTREEVAPGGIAVFGSLDLDRGAAEQKRRFALAEWIASPDNPLTARVLANRLWQFHFGTGIVDTPSDFGHNGAEPTHPELLDWLAAELVANDWSIKHLHRLILHSATWRQDNEPRPDALRVDVASRLLWRFPPRRLEAEGIRDSVLAVTGVLDLEDRGGPGFSAFEIEAENVRHYHPKTDYGPEDWRRMIYMTKVRQEKDSIFGAFDCPDASQTVAKRSRSTTPMQALNLLNSSFMMEQAELLAKRVEDKRSGRAQQVEFAWQLCFQRPPEPAELADSIAFIEAEGLVQFFRAILNSNEFVFIP